jgi:hypothetical protein
MPEPNDADVFPEGVELLPDTEGHLLPTDRLATLFVEARNAYRWPFRLEPHASQFAIHDLERNTEASLRALTLDTAYDLVVGISEWAGNRRHSELVSADDDTRASIFSAVTELIQPGQEAHALNNLSNLPGISLVVASKIFRFVRPREGASIDRHTSYFFNSLPIVGDGKATQFRREWIDGRHMQSRLATSNQYYLAQNLAEYTEVYLKRLHKIAEALNLRSQLFVSVTDAPTEWRAADIEMAAFYWWSCNGAR